MHGDADKVRQMVQARPEMVNLLTADNRSAIELSLRQSRINLAILRLLIDGGAQVKNHPTVYDEKGIPSPSGLLGIAVAASAPSLEAVGMLIDAGAEPFDPSSNCWRFPGRRRRIPGAHGVIARGRAGKQAGGGD